MAANPVSDKDDNVIAIRKGRGGARPGAGRKPKAPNPFAKAGCHFVYVIHERDDPNVCKVGVASNPLGRLSALQVGTWRPLVIGALIEVGDETHALAVERLAHSYMRGLHESGEWFRVAVGDAVAFVAQAKDACAVAAQKV